MSDKSTAHGPDVYAYVERHSLRPPAVLDELLEATRRNGHFGMASTALQGQFLAFLVRAMQARRVIEVGVFTGVGTLWLAEAVGPEGRVVALDVSDQFTSVGKPFWAKAGVADRIDLRLGPAADSLRALDADGQRGSFDFAYIDADKEAYDTYYELVLPLLRPGGVIAFDNMLQGGRVLDETATGAATTAIRNLNGKLHRDPRVYVSFLPLCDGVYLACKR